MIRYTVLIAQRDSAVAVSRQLPDLCDFFESLEAPLDVIVVDDGSSADSFEMLEEQLLVCPMLRLIRLEQPRGVGYALSAGIAAARGDVVVAIEAGDRYPPSQISKLLDGLVHADLVCAKRPRASGANLWRRAANFTRWVLPTSPVDDPGCLFWVARREAVAGIDLSDGMERYLASLVAARGFRVDQASVTTRQTKPESSDTQTSRSEPAGRHWQAGRRKKADATESCKAGGSGSPIQLEVPPSGDAPVPSHPPQESV